jgi:valyl-tRNA synthetase
MPFVTEALWAALPHRASDPDLLIVARWPGGGARDATAEAHVEAIKDLVTEIRNARATAKVPAGEWLATRVYVPADLGSTFEALRPGVERLARARPLLRDLSMEQLQAQAQPSDLMVIVPGGETSALVRPAGAASAGSLERERLERELAEAEGWLAAARERLTNDAFTSRAPAPVVEGARAREAELADQVARLRDALGR